MITIYRTVLYLGLPLLFLRLLYQALRNKQYIYRISQRFGLNLPMPDEKYGIDAMASYHGGIWIHAVSVGEVNAATPLINHLLEKYPNYLITVTTMTPTGSERVHKNFGENVIHSYVPYDYPGSVNRFLNAVRPKLAMVMETEIWPNLISECHKRNIPMIYTNVRLSARSHKGYKRFKKLFGPVLNKISRFAVQAQVDAERLFDLGANSASIEVTGSIKFEMTLPASVQEAAQSVRRDLGWERAVLVAGSTHEGEDSKVIDAFLKAKKQISNLLLVLVPRHPERFSTVYRLCNRYECKTLLRSQTKGKIPEDTEIYLADTMGDLALLVAAGDVAFIGGSLAPTGGHNLLEACAAGIVVIFGPHMFNFEEISHLVLSKEAGIQVMDSDELCEVVIKLINDPALRDQYGSRGKELIQENKGALEKILTMVEIEMSK